MTTKRRSARLSSKQNEKIFEEEVFEISKKEEVITKKRSRKVIEKDKDEEEENQQSVKAKKKTKKEKVEDEENEGEEDSEIDMVEVNRLKQMLHYERQIIIQERKRLEKQGCSNIDEEMKNFVIVGVDEVGVGPLAGPTVSCAVVLAIQIADESTQYNYKILPDINDSKKLKIHQREFLSKQIKENAFAYNLGICTSKEVDQLNPREASMEAMRRAVKGLLDGPLKKFRVHLLVDYHTVPKMPISIKQTCFSKGDAKSQSIAAASIVAKVFRDAYMVDLHKQYPDFGFDKNAGYGTALHMAALRSGLICPEHRLSFAPVRIAYENIQKAKKAQGLSASSSSSEEEDVEMERSESQKENEGPFQEDQKGKQKRNTRKVKDSTPSIKSFLVSRA